MNTISLDDYYSAGYFLIRKNKCPEWLDEPVGLMPSEIISLEAEFCSKLNVGWGWIPGDPDAATRFGIDEMKWHEFKDWCANHHDHDFEVWTMFRSTNAARHFVEMFIPATKRDGLTIIGAGLHKSRMDDWQEPYGTEGVELRILQHLSMESGGQILGFEITGYAYHNFDHSWFSHGHHRGVFKELGIRPGRLGLLQTREEAILARDYTDAHDGNGYTYEYWLLVEYPIPE